MLTAVRGIIQNSRPWVRLLNLVYRPRRQRSLQYSREDLFIKDYHGLILVSNQGASQLKQNRSEVPCRWTPVNSLTTILHRMTMVNGEWPQLQPRANRMAEPRLAANGNRK